MLVSTSTYADDDGDPGDLAAVLELDLAHRDMAWANVATNNPIANWLGLSCKNVCTMRGEN